VLDTERIKLYGSVHCTGFLLLAENCSKQNVYSRMPPVTGHRPNNAAPHVTIKFNFSTDAQGLASIREVLAATNSLFTKVALIDSKQSWVLCVYVYAVCIRVCRVCMCMPCVYVCMPCV